jgi:cysteine desulfurase/selenocysteine lyase
VSGRPVTYVPRLGDRSLFPLLAARAYLNHAALSPPSSAVVDAVANSLAGYARSGLTAAIEQRLEREDLRAMVAQLMGAGSDDIAFVQSTSAGVTAIARSLPFHAGERVIAFGGEFPANVTPWQLVAAEKNLQLTLLSLESFERSNDEGLAELAGALSGGARLVAVSAVQFQTGLRMPLRAMAELCHAHGAELFVDAIQGLGAVPLDVRETGIDYLSAGGHKFLMGLEGAGVLYVRPEAMQKLSLGMGGWTGHEDAFRFLIAPGQLRYDRPLVRKASVFEQGALSVTGYAALTASLAMLLELGIERIHTHINHYLDALEPALIDLGCRSVRAREPERRSATLSIRLPGHHVLSDVARSLLASGVSVATPDGYLRFSPHWPNDVAEIPHVITAMKRALG